MGCSILNQPATGDPPWVESPADPGDAMEHQTPYDLPVSSCSREAFSTPKGGFVKGDSLGPWCGDFFRWFMEINDVYYTYIYIYCFSIFFIIISITVTVIIIIVIIINNNNNMYIYIFIYMNVLWDDILYRSFLNICILHYSYSWSWSRLSHWLSELPSTCGHVAI